MALAGVIVLWPITAGVAAMEQVRHERSGSIALTEALPRAAAVRDAMRRSLAPGAATLVGMLCGLAIALVVASVNGSTASWRAVAGVPAAVIGCLTFAALGAAFGSYIRSWLTPPLVAAGVYGLFAFDAAGVQSLLSFAGATSPAVVSIEVPAGIMVSIAGVFAGLMVVGLVIVVGRSAQWAPWVSATAAVVGSVLFFWNGGVSEKWTWQWRDDSTWPCIEVLEQGAQLCLPSDQQRDLPAYAAVLAPITQRLAQLDESWARVRYTTVLGSESVGVDPPLGLAGFDTADLAIGLAWTVPGCLTDDEPLDERQHEMFTSAVLTVAAWSAPEALPPYELMASYGLPHGEPARVDAEAAYSVLDSCQI